MQELQILCLGLDESAMEERYWRQLKGLSENIFFDTFESVDVDKYSQVTVLLVALGAKISKQLIDQLPSLKYIGMMGTGYGGIDVAYATNNGITVTNIADYATGSVTEFTFGIMLEHLREISKARAQAKAGDYSDNFQGGEIRGKKFGVIGLGYIGLRTAEVAHVFGAEVSYWSRNRKKEAENKGIRYTELDNLLAESDIITLNLAYNKETEGIISQNRINLIKQGSVFINPSPMELVDFEQLVERLKKKDIVFMLDHSDETTIEQLKILLPLDNAIVHPAIAYVTHEASALKKQIFVDNITNFLKKKTTNKVN